MYAQHVKACGEYQCYAPTVQIYFFKEEHALLTVSLQEESAKEVPLLNTLLQRHVSAKLWKLDLVTQLWTGSNKD